MTKNAMKDRRDLSYLSGENRSYLDRLYQAFLVDPYSVEASWPVIFNQLKTVGSDYQNILCEDADSVARLRLKEYKQGKVFQLIDDFRLRGHQYANLDPLGLWRRKNATFKDLNLMCYEFTDADGKDIYSVGSFKIGRNTMPLDELYAALKHTYCGSIGTEYMYIANIEEKKWIQTHIESGIVKNNFTSENKKSFLKDLTAAEGLEHYLGMRFPGRKRFSLEGCEALIPMLKEMVRYSAKNGIKEVILGMTHRGRFNVLVNILGKNTKDLFDDFDEHTKVEGVGTGDVQYHQGFSSNVEIGGNIVHLSLAFNPSHLEIISPVVMGLARAHIDKMEMDADAGKVLTVTLHGDAAIIGQGVVQETLNMSKVRGYDIGGTVRIVINNQIGFTTSNILDTRSTQYCTDVAKMVQAPIFHVNADDMEAVIFITRVALDFRNTFKRDVIIDLVGYRRHSHNEVDEPKATQPLMYNKIQSHPTARKIYANQLEREGIIDGSEAIKMIELFYSALDKGDCVLEWQIKSHDHSIWNRYLHPDCHDGYPSQVDKIYLQELAKRISYLPVGMEIQSRVSKIYHDRAAMAIGEKSFDWGGAEMLAYATLIDQGIPVRLSGEDTTRGTFFHRHAVVHHQTTGITYTPMHSIRNGKKCFHVWDSVLSEEAVLAFEYGYATTNPCPLVLWEAQFGDFANGAQVIIDQFISSGEQKWGQLCGLVMLLPHGYEGQGPEHSSARLERFLQLCAENNMQVCVPSTPAQLYHVLRRQVLRDVRRPLILMSPKSLLRHPLASSSLEELAKDTFHTVIGEVNDNIDPKNVKRVVMCAGKVFYDLLSKRRDNKQHNVAIIRIEQLYPFPKNTLMKVLYPYQHVKDIVWCQEEPYNQGAWYYNQHHLREIIVPGTSLSYIGRPAAASPAVGYFSLHQAQQNTLINDALCVVRHANKG